MRMTSVVDWILLVVGLFYVVAFVFIWMNRGSEKIVTTAIPLGVAGILGTILALLVFGNQEPLTAAFPAGFFINLKDKTPYQLPWLFEGKRFFQAAFTCKQLFDSNPKAFSEPSDPQELYHHLLQKALVDWMSFRYGSSWQIEVTPLSGAGIAARSWGPAGGEERGDKTLLSKEDLQRLMRTNKFGQFGTPSNQGISLPPRTKLKIIAPQLVHGFEGREMGSIELKNRFVTLLITTKVSYWGQGIGGYAQLLGVSQEDAQKQWGMLNYLVRIRADFNRVLPGNPEMPKHKKWAQDIVSALQDQFDEQALWKRATEDYLLYRALPAQLPTSPHTSSVYGHASANPTKMP